MISYISTRGFNDRKNFEEALLAGLAPDGGLYVPERWPQLPPFIPPASGGVGGGGKSYADIAEAVMFPFVEGSLSRADLRAMIDATYHEKIFSAEIAPLKDIGGGLHVLELFHGPTLAFKDFALQFLGRLFDHVLKKRNEKITIVGATSGDTGSAAIEGCRHSAHVNIFILHPHGRVSDVQRRQMTTVDASNVHNIAVEGTFDDCQALVKALFADEKFRRDMNLSAVNSINWARIMAQIVYYFYTALQVENASFVVPTGNFGNVFAGYVAKKMGAPIKNLVIATNRNDILARFFANGEMKQQGVVPTISPSMDIQVSSNFERYLFEVLDRDAGKLSALMKEFKDSGKFSVSRDLLKKAQGDFTARRCDEAGTLATMKKIYEETGTMLDPHSAVGVAAVPGIRDGVKFTPSPIPVVSLATAHPAKFPDAVEKATGKRPELPGRLAGLMERPEKFDVLPANPVKLAEFIRKNRHC